MKYHYVLCACAMASVLTWAQQFGSTDLEPGLEDRSDVVIFEDFEESDWSTHWELGQAPNNCSVVSSPAFKGSKALRVHVPQGEHYGTGDLRFKFKARIGYEPEEIYFRYYVNFASNWQQNDYIIGKLPGLAGTYGQAGWGGRVPDGTDGWSARMGNRDMGETVMLTFYCYHPDQAGQWGEDINWYATRDVNSQPAHNKWYCIESYVKMNTITGTKGNHDGILRGWTNGVLSVERTDLRFRDVSTLKIEDMWFNIYVGGEWTAPQDMDVYFDNVVIAKNYIGPYGSSAIKVGSVLTPVQTSPSPYVVYNVRGQVTARLAGQLPTGTHFVKFGSEAYITFRALR